MQVPNAVASPKPTVIVQLDIFGGSVEIPLNPTKPSKHTASEGGNRACAGQHIEAHRPTAAAPAVAPRPPAQDDTEDDDAPTVNLESIDANDTPEMILAKRMFLRMLWDLAGDVEEAEPDLFGQTSIQCQKASLAEQCRLDALIWLYSLNPDAGLVTFEWVCDVLGFDPHRVRRITGRSMRNDLKRVVQLLSTIISLQHAQACEEKIADYCDISSWNLN